MVVAVTTGGDVGRGMTSASSRRPSVSLLSNAVQAHARDDRDLAHHQMEHRMKMHAQIQTSWSGGVGAVAGARRRRVRAVAAGAGFQHAAPWETKPAARCVLERGIGMRE